MIEGVISSKTKINVLVKLFLNPAIKAYLRGLAKEFDVSTNSVRTELNILTEHGILVAEKDGRSVYYRANTQHPLFPELTSMVRKITGIDQLARSVIERLGRLEAVYLTGDYAQGKDTGIIDLVLLGNVDREELEDVVRKTENYIKRKIRTMVLNHEEYEKLNSKGSLPASMLLWSREANPMDDNNSVAGSNKYSIGKT